MADRKEYEMLFALNARMNGGFSGTFSKAQAEFSRLGKEVQELHKLQGDVASYQKQQTAIEATRSKLENLQKQHDLLQKEISETSGSTTALEREKAKLEQRIKDTETALDRQTQKLETTGAKLKEAGVDTSNLAQKDAELTAKIKELKAEQDKAADSAVSFGERSSRAIEAAGDAIAAAGITLALKEIASAYMDCVGGAADFQETMSTVEALSQASAQEMAALTAEAKELGATTKFTAKESGDAMGYMAMAGWDANDMLQGMNGVLQLAAASGEDLAMVSDIVTDSLSAFGLTAKDSAHFSDVLAAAATSSNTNVSIMGETFKMSASVAGALGYSIEDVAAAMGLMANSGVKGSIAGTALRNTFNGLLEGVTLTGAAFGEYEYCAVRADGTMKDFGATIDELRGYFEQMTEAERVNNAQTIAGERGYNGLLAILNATDADYESLTASIENCTGAAERMAAIKLDNLNGQLTLMNSAWDALKTTIGEEFNPELQDLAEIGTDVLTLANDFVEEHPALVRGVMAGAGAFGALAFGITGVTAAMKLASAASAIFAGTMGVALGPVVAVTAAVAGVVGVVTALSTAANEGVPSVKELTEASRDMNNAIEDANTVYRDTTESALAAANVADTYIAKLEEIEAATDGNVAENQEYRNVLTLLTRTVPELADLIDEETGAIEGGTAALRANIAQWQENAKAQAYQEYMNSLMDEYNAVMVEAAANEIKLTEAHIKTETAAKGLDDTYQRLLDALGMTDYQLKAHYGTVQNIPYWEMGGEIGKLCNEYTNYQNQLRKSQAAERNLTKAIEADNSAVAEAETALAGAQAAYDQLNSSTQGLSEAEVEAAQQTQALKDSINDTMGEVAALTEAYNELYDAALNSVQGQYAIWDKAADVVITSAGSINSALQSQITYWEKYNTNLESLQGRTADIEGLGDVIASFADGSQDSVNAVAGMVNASDDELRTMVENWRKLQEEQQMVSDSIAQIAADVPGQLQQIEDSVRESIAEMEFRDEAAKSAHDMIQAFIDQADGMIPLVQDAYGKLGAAANNALAERFSYNSAGVNNYYASGTDNAKRGLAVVGEEGPELVYFGGGEKVLNAQETSRLASNAVSAIPSSSAFDGGFPPVQISVRVEGNATPETAEALRTAAQDIAEMAVERVMDELENRREDGVRRKYS